MKIDPKRQHEVDKYHQAYKNPRYAMGNNRKNAAHRHLTELNITGTMLDIGCGRGEMLDFANSIGLEAIGLDPATHSFREDVIEGLATDIPFEDNSFTIVTTFDMMEHLLHEDHVPALEEMKRVAQKYCVIAAANFPSGNLHISHMPDADWEALFNTVYSKVQKLPKYGGISGTWLCTV